MPSDATNHLQGEQRLHPTTLFFNLFSILRQFLIPGLIVIFLGRGERFDVWIMVLIIPAIIAAIVKYISLRYVFADEELIVKQGILNRTERHIPYPRIQNIDTSQNLLHRILNVADVTIQTASGTEPEAVLKVMSLNSVSYMRGKIFGQSNLSARVEKVGKAEEIPSDKDHGTDGQQSSEGVEADLYSKLLLRKLTFGDLVINGIISNRGLVAVAALLGLIYQFDIGLPKESMEEFLDSLNIFETFSTMVTIGLALLFLVIVVVLLRLLSILWSLISLYDYMITRANQELRIEYGLFTRVSLTIPIHRIQVIEIKQTVLHRLFRSASITARTAGSARDEQGGRRQDWLLPWIPYHEISQFLSQIDGGIRFDFQDWRAVAPKAWRRVFVKRLIILSIFCVILGSWSIPWGVSSFIFFVPTLVLYSRKYARNLGYAIDDRMFWTKVGWLRKTIRLTQFQKMQMITLKNSPFDRRHQMATVSVDTANAGQADEILTVPYLNESEALSLYEYLSHQAAETSFRW